MNFLIPPWLSVPLKFAGNFLKAIPWKVWAFLIVLACVWMVRQDGYRDGYATAKAEDAAQDAKAREESQAALIAEQEKAREDLRRANEKMRDIETKLIEDGRKEIEKREAVIADLRSGALRLRKRFQCPTQSGSASGTAAAAAVRDGETQSGLSGSDAEFLIREASRADEIVRQLGEAQTVIIEYQAICGAKNP